MAEFKKQPDVLVFYPGITIPYLFQSIKVLIQKIVSNLAEIGNSNCNLFKEATDGF